MAQNMHSVYGLGCKKPVELRSLPKIPVSTVIEPENIVTVAVTNTSLQNAVTQMSHETKKMRPSMTNYFSVGNNHPNNSCFLPVPCIKALTEKCLKEKKSPQSLHMDKDSDDDIEIVYQSLPIKEDLETSKINIRFLPSQHKLHTKFDSSADEFRHGPGAKGNNDLLPVNKQNLGESFNDFKSKTLSGDLITSTTVIESLGRCIKRKINYDSPILSNNLITSMPSTSGDHTSSLMNDSPRPSQMKRLKANSEILENLLVENIDSQARESILNSNVQMGTNSMHIDMRNKAEQKELVDGSDSESVQSGLGTNLLENSVLLTRHNFEKSVQSLSEPVRLRNSYEVMDEISGLEKLALCPDVTEYFEYSFQQTKNTLSVEKKAEETTEGTLTGEAFKNVKKMKKSNFNYIKQWLIDMNNANESTSVPKRTEDCRLEISEAVQMQQNVTEDVFAIGSSKKRWQGIMKKSRCDLLESYQDSMAQFSDHRAVECSKNLEIGPSSDGACFSSNSISKCVATGCGEKPVIELHCKIMQDCIKLDKNKIDSFVPKLSVLSEIVLENYGLATHLCNSRVPQIDEHSQSEKFYLQSQKSNNWQKNKSGNNELFPSSEDSNQQYDDVSSIKSLSCEREVASDIQEVVSCSKSSFCDLLLSSQSSSCRELFTPPNIESRNINGNEIDNKTTIMTEGPNQTNIETFLKSIDCSKIERPEEAMENKHGIENFTTDHEIMDMMALQTDTDNSSNTSDTNLEIELSFMSSANLSNCRKEPEVSKIMKIEVSTGINQPRSQLKSLEDQRAEILEYQSQKIEVMTDQPQSFVSQNQRTAMSQNHTTTISQNHATTISQNHTTTISQNHTTTMSQNLKMAMSQNHIIVSKSQKGEVSQQQEPGMSQNQKLPESPKAELHLSRKTEMLQSLRTLLPCHMPEMSIYQSEHTHNQKEEILDNEYEEVSHNNIQELLLHQMEVSHNHKGDLSDIEKISVSWHSQSTKDSQSYNGEVSQHQMAGVSQNQMGEVPWSQLAGVSQSQIAGVSPCQMTGVSSCQMTGVSPCQMTGVSPCQMTGVSPCQMTGVSPCQMTGVSQNQMTEVSQIQLAEVSQNQMAVISQIEMVGESHNQMAGVLQIEKGEVSQGLMAGMSQNLNGVILQSQMAGALQDQKGEVSQSQATGVSESLMGEFAHNQIATVSLNQKGDISWSQIAGQSQSQEAGVPQNQKGEVSQSLNARVSLNQKGEILQSPMAGESQNQMTAIPQNQKGNVSPSPMVGVSQNLKGKVSPILTARVSQNLKRGMLQSPMAGTSQNPKRDILQSSMAEGSQNLIGEILHSQMAGVPQNRKGEVSASLATGVSQNQSGEFSHSPMAGVSQNQKEEVSSSLMAGVSQNLKRDVLQSPMAGTSQNPKRDILQSSTAGGSQNLIGEILHSQMAGVPQNRKGEVSASLAIGVSQNQNGEFSHSPMAGVSQNQKEEVSSSLMAGVSQDLKRGMLQSPMTGTSQNLKRDILQSQISGVPQNQKGDISPSVATGVSQNQKEDVSQCLIAGISENQKGDILQSQMARVPHNQREEVSSNLTAGVSHDQMGDILQSSTAGGSQNLGGDILQSPMAGVSQNLGDILQNPLAGVSQNQEGDILQSKMTGESQNQRGEVSQNQLTRALQREMGNLYTGTQNHLIYNCKTKEQPIENDSHNQLNFLADLSDNVDGEKRNCTVDAKVDDNELCSIKHNIWLSTANYNVDSSVQDDKSANSSTKCNLPVCATDAGSFNKCSANYNLVYYENADTNHAFEKKLDHIAYHCSDPIENTSNSDGEDKKGKRGDIYCSKVALDRSLVDKYSDILSDCETEMITNISPSLNKSCESTSIFIKNNCENESLINIENMPDGQRGDIYKKYKLKKKTLTQAVGDLMISSSSDIQLHSSLDCNFESDQENCQHAELLLDEKAQKSIEVNGIMMNVKPGISDRTGLLKSNSVPLSATISCSKTHRSEKDCNENIKLDLPSSECFAPITEISTNKKEPAISLCCVSTNLKCDNKTHSMELEGNVNDLDIPCTQYFTPTLDDNKEKAVESSCLVSSSNEFPCSQGFFSNYKNANEMILTQPFITSPTALSFPDSLFFNRISGENELSDSDRKILMKGDDGLKKNKYFYNEYGIIGERGGELMAEKLNKHECTRKNHGEDTISSTDFVYPAPLSRSSKVPRLGLSRVQRVSRLHPYLINSCIPLRHQTPCCASKREVEE